MLEQDETLHKRLCRSYLALEGAVERSHDDDLSEARHQLAEGDDVTELRSGTAGETPSTPAEETSGRRTNWPSSMPMQSKSAASCFTSRNFVHDTAASICLTITKMKN